MNKIKILESHLANLIAAGEVAIDPYSVIKELVENCIDAKAKSIKIDLSESGYNHIIIEDDGIGMSKNDALMCIKRHATSKIKTEHDLNNISTLGFRGEAVTSIASVSRFKIETSDLKESTTVLVDGGKLINTTNSSSVKKGTKISVHNLFFNTPARLKHQTTTRYQFSIIKEYVYQMSIIKKNIEFILIHNDEVIYQSYVDDLQSNIAQIYGVEVAKNMNNINYSNMDFIINGYFIDPKYSKPNKKAIILSINNRLIWSNKINNAIISALDKYLMVGKYPICYFNIELDPSIIDVNIHPQKKQVRISKENDLINILQLNIVQKYRENFKVFEATFDSKNNNVIKNQAFKINVNEQLEKKEDKILIEENKYKEDIIFETKSLEYEEKMNISENESEKFIEFNSRTYKIGNVGKERNTLKEIKYIGQYLNSYIIGQSEDKLVLVDQHAAMERINYELYLSQLKINEKYFQKLVIPIKFSLSSSDISILESNKDNLLILGIEYDIFGNDTILIRKIPSYINSLKIEKFLNLIFNYIFKNKKITKEDLINEIAIIKACKLSVKANQILNQFESEKLFESLYYVDNYTQCPHGRPIIIYLSKSEIEKLFKRIV